MCVPAAVASLAVSAASAYVGYQSSVNSAVAQAAANAKSTASLISSNALNSAQTDLNTQQERAAASEQIQENSLNAAKARARATVAAGEAGVMGNTIDAQMRNYFFQELGANQTLQTNYENLVAQNNLEKQGQSATTQTQINSLPTASKPSFLDAGLRIASAGLKKYEDYNTTSGSTKKTG